MIKNNYILVNILNGCDDSNQYVNTVEKVLNEVLLLLLLFEFVANTRNNSQRLRYEIKFINLNNKFIKGFYSIKTNQR